MKAAVLDKYSKENINLVITEVTMPRIKENEVLVKVLAAGVNPVDNMISRGEVKLIVPYKLPQIAGNELVGEICEKGNLVSNFNIGDRIFSRLPLDNIGAFAEYIAIDSKAIAKVPEYLSNEEAAAIPLTALTVMQALEIMKVKSNDTIFISGGTGGLGAMAIPIAKSFGLKVITNGNGMNKQRVLDLGADEFIDYKEEDYTKILKDIDFVLDTVGGDETRKQMTIMKKGGKLVSLKGMPNKTFAKRMNLGVIPTFLFSLVGKKMDKLANEYGVSYDFIYVTSNGKQLEDASKIFSDNNIKVSIDEVFDFNEINTALNKVNNGGSKGKTVIKFN